MSGLAEAFAVSGLATLASDESLVEELHYTEPPRDVTDRKLLWGDGIIECRVPPEAKIGEYSDLATRITYLQFPIRVRGGVINAHVRGEKPLQWKGRTITARVELWDKTLRNNTGYFYIDLHPVKAAPTHRMDVVSADGDEKLPDWCTTVGERHAFVAEIPPLKVAVVFTPAPGPIAAAQPPTTEKPAVPSTGDGQLDRLLNDGWQIDRDNGSVVVLWKMKGGKRREMSHHRPKKK